MYSVAFAREREKRIQVFLSLYPYSSTSILYSMFFVHTHRRKCQQVLTRMSNNKNLNVNRVMCQEYIYYLGKRNRQWKHMADVTQFHFDVLFRLNKHSDIIYHKREFEYTGGKADALYIVGGEVGKKFFLEMDDMRNEFLKVEQYENYFKSGIWKREFWADPLKSGRVSFPLLLVVTERKIPGSEIIKVVTCKQGSNYVEALKSG